MHELGPSPLSLGEFGSSVELFNATNQENLGRLLTGSVIHTATPQKAVRLTEIQVWGRDEVKPHFKTMHTMSPGSVWAQGYRASVILHIVTRDKATGETGACIALKKGVELRDPVTGEFVPSTSDTQISEYLGFERNSSGRVELSGGRLSIVRDTEVMGGNVDIIDQLFDGIVEN